MEVSAKLRFLRISPQKVRLVVDAIRGLPVDKAEYRLIFLRKRSARPVLKLLKSAIANAENNFKLKKDNLFIKTIKVDQGPTLKRWKPRAFGRAATILKRSSHITIILDEVETGRTKAKAAKSTDKRKTKKPSQAGPEKRPIVDYQDVKHEAKGKKEVSGALPEDQKKTFSKSFKSIKDKFSRRLGEK